jgi:hypothetical protein
MPQAVALQMHSSHAVFKARGWTDTEHSGSGPTWIDIQDSLVTSDAVLMTVPMQNNVRLLLV